MSKKKPIRTRGKLQFSRYFQTLKEGDRVAVVMEPSLQPRFPKRLQGRTGIIEGKKGGVFIVNINDLNKEKKFLIESAHLRRIQT